MRFNFLITLLAIFMLSVNSLAGQQNSYPVKVINGEEYYVYKVEAGEGLFSISRKFDVTQADINNLNPQIHEGLKAGQEILIPKKKSDNAVTAVAAVTSVPNNLSEEHQALLNEYGNDYEVVLHTVERRQTVFGISRLYNVSQSSIVKANPKIAQRALQTGDVLAIIVRKSSAPESVRPAATAQTTDPKKTEDKPQNGDFIQHQVRMFETLYSISRKYEVSVSEIKAANPQLNGQLKSGDVLRIPQKGSSISPASTEKTKTGKEETGKSVTSGQTHQVAQGETLYSISRQYNVTVDDLVSVNPESAEVLKTGAILQIPDSTKSQNDLQKEQLSKEEPLKAEESEKESRNFFQKIADKFSGRDNELPDEVIAEMEKEYHTHKVRRFETLYSIGKKYGVTVDRLVELNPESADKLKTGTTLKIKKRAVREDKPEVKEPEVILSKDTYKVAYLLPFMTNSNDDPTAYKFIEFYMGSLLALNNVKNGSMNFEVYAYDIEKSEAKLREVLRKPELSKMDLIIGPAYTVQVPALAQFAKTYKINTVIPFTSKVENIDNNPYLFQFNPDFETQNEYFVQLIRNQFAASQLVLVETGDTNSFYPHLKRELGNQNLRFRTVSKSEFDQIEQFLSTGKNNIVILDTENFAEAKPYLSALYALDKSYDIVAFGQYSWRAQSGEKPKMYYTAPFMGNKKASNFYENEYSKYYGVRHSGDNPRYDLIGYDLSNFFFSTMQKRGFSFDTGSREVSYNKGVQSDFNFKRSNSDSGLVNHKMYLIVDHAKAK